MQPVAEGKSLGEPSLGNPTLEQCLWQKFPWPLEGAQSLTNSKVLAQAGGSLPASKSVLGI